MLMARVLMDNIHRIHCIFACISAIKHKLILKKKLITDKIARVEKSRTAPYRPTRMATMNGSTGPCLS